MALVKITKEVPVCDDCGKTEFDTMYSRCIICNSWSCDNCFHGFGTFEPLLRIMGKEYFSFQLCNKCRKTKEGVAVVAAEINYRASLVSIIGNAIKGKQKK